MNHDKFVLKKLIDYINQRLTKIPNEAIKAETMEQHSMFRGAYGEIEEIQRQIADFITEAKKMEKQRENQFDE